jgi:hypothetical protein
MTHGQRRRVGFVSLLFVLIAATLQLTKPDWDGFGVRGLGRAKPV